MQKSRARVLVTDIVWPDLSVESGVLDDASFELVLVETGEEAELCRLAVDADAILTCWKRVTAAVLDAAPRCRVVSRYGIGLDNIDVARASELGIAVTNVPDYCIEEVSDHVLALLFAHARRIVLFSAETRAGSWSLEGAGSLPRLSEQTLGLIGYGRTAHAVARKARALGLEVLVWTPRLPAGELDEGVEATASRDELLARSHWVSLHVPLTPATERLVDASFLASMRTDAVLINTARGAVVDEEALLRALESRQIAGAALDVLRQEPPPPDHPLLARNDVIATPHAAFTSGPAIRELARRAAEHVREVLQGRLPECTVNREKLASASWRGA